MLVTVITGVVCLSVGFVAGAAAVVGSVQKAPSSEAVQGGASGAPESLESSAGHRHSWSMWELEDAPRPGESGEGSAGGEWVQSRRCSGCGYVQREIRSL